MNLSGSSNDEGSPPQAGSAAGVVPKAGAGAKGKVEAGNYQGADYSRYFKADGRGLTIFDYNAYGLTQDKADKGKPPPKAEGAEADPTAQLKRLEADKRQLTQWLNGKHTKTTCPTFPYCNHIPAPPPMMPPPAMVAKPQSGQVSRVN